MSFRLAGRVIRTDPHVDDEVVCNASATRNEKAGASVVICGNSEASGASGALMKRGVPSRLTLPVSRWRNALWKQTITFRA